LSTGPQRAGTVVLNTVAMSYNTGSESLQAKGHSRTRSQATKGSSESPPAPRSKEKGNKPPSQKAMLSRALQKANTAVQLDNAKNLEGARHAYAEACDLLHQVLLRTSAEEDQRKLEAIVSLLNLSI
jgi:hypothetical protein